MATKPQHKQLQPNNRTSASFDGDGFKLHQRTLVLGGSNRRPWTVLTLRPGTQATFSTNYFHNTHHIISDQSGSRLLTRLLWGLAFCQTPGLVIALHGEHIRPMPFDADPSLPILLIPAHQTHIDAGAFRTLKTHLQRLGPPEKTVRWRTFGLDAALAAQKEFGPHEANLWWAERQAERKTLTDREWKRERMAVCGGFLCYSAPPVILKCQAHSLHYLRVKNDDTDYHYLAEGRPYRSTADGEVQIFGDYHHQLSVARVARREVRDESPDHCDPEALRGRVQARIFDVAARRKKWPVPPVGV